MKTDATDLQCCKKTEVSCTTAGTSEQTTETTQTKDGDVIQSLIL